MNKITTLSLFGGVVLAGTAMAGEVVQPAPVESKFESLLSVGYHDNYVDRGFQIGDDTISADVATSFACPYTGMEISAGITYLSQHDFLDTGLNVDELRYQIAGAYDLGFATGHVGYIHYHYNDPFGFDVNDDQEVYFGLSKNLYGYDTSLTYFWGIHGPFRGNNEGYLEGRVNKSFDVLGHSINADVTAGYLIEEGELSHVTAKLTYDYKLTETATLSPYVAYAVELDDLDQTFGAFQPIPQENTFFAGASLTVTF
ncbi:hypothetical protein SAMN02745181_2794 [Rubritalea squalenifaciens DSM 18772]|uniref:Uncharacterized protein n=1 Tax=Rubritalea squalenifaciens DSM 18772 TaxID=1123071 RepID=A0A1M6NAQ1_9BACT|nr:hypothetical protein [Rubritalea squalenifaciens]SHJ92761.1 hypothetical protein SAMN02745181_2794 [Rubritalea squalenifaciens DSM 18772]